MTFSCRSEFASDVLVDVLRDRGATIIPYDPGISDEQAQSLLVTGMVDVMLTSPLEYARAVGLVDCGLIPGIALSTRGATGLMRLLFGEGRGDIRTVRVRRDRPYETVVTRILLAEKHDLAPEFIEVDNHVMTADMLAGVDAALLAGDDALFNAGEHRSLLDMSDEWEDVVEDPLPYLIAWGRIGSVTEPMIVDLTQARDAALAGLADTAARHPRTEQASAFHQACVRGNVSYRLDADAARGLETFYRYAFYHGVIQDIPALKYAGGDR